MLRLLLLAALWLTCPVRACLTEFASLGAVSEADIETLSVETYGKLLDTLAGTLPPAGWERMAAAGDPFAVPKDFGDFSGLEKYLLEYRDILKKKGWETPALRMRLVAELIARNKVVQSAKLKVDTAVRDIPKDRQVKVGTDEHVLPIPGRSDFYVQSLERGPSRIYEAFLVDVETGVRTSWSGAKRKPLSPQFSPDGQNLVLGESGNRLRVVPIGPAGPMWGKAKIFPRVDSEEKRAAQDFQFGRSASGSELVYATYGPEDAPTVRFDLKDRTRLAIDWQAVNGEKRGTAVWGVIPGSEELFAATFPKGKGGVPVRAKDRKLRIDLVKVGAEGKAVVTTTGHAEFPMAWGQIAWPHRDGPIYAYDKDRAMVILPGQAKPEVLWERRLQGIETVAVHPDGKSMAILTTTGRVFWVDAASKRELAEIIIPASLGGAPRIYFLPNGKLLARGYGVEYAIVLEAETRLQN